MLARSIKDTVTRFWTMMGYKVERRVGWDCHGLPVENEVEKELGIKSKKEIEEKFGIEKFNAICRASVFRYKKEWENTLQRMGRWADYENAYATLDNNYIESVWWVFKQLWDKKLVYKDYRVTAYCSRCGTSLSNFEVNQGYKDTEDIKIKIQSEDSQKQEYLILAKERLGAIDKKYEVVEKIKGKNLAGLEYEPLYQFIKLGKKAHFVVADKCVSIEDGTGIVHIAPAFGEDDMRIGKINNLPLIFSVDDGGKFLPAINPWAGKFVKDADPEIIKELQNRNLLFKSEKIKHSYPFC